MKIQLITTLDIDLQGENPKDILEVYQALIHLPAFFKDLSINPEAWQASVAKFETTVTEIPNLLEKPLTNEQVATLQDKDGWIDVTLNMSQDDLAKDIDILNDIVETKIIGPETDGYFSDLNFSIIGCSNANQDQGGNVLLRVRTQIVND